MPPPLNCLRCHVYSMFYCPSWGGWVSFFSVRSCRYLMLFQEQDCMPSNTYPQSLRSKSKYSNYSRDFWETKGKDLLLLEITSVTIGVSGLQPLKQLKPLHLHHFCSFILGCSGAATHGKPSRNSQATYISSSSFHPLFAVFQSSIEVFAITEQRWYDGMTQFSTFVDITSHSVESHFTVRKTNNPTMLTWTPSFTHLYFSYFNM